MDQGLEGSSIRNSHREIHAVRGKPAPKHIAEGPEILAGIGFTVMVRILKTEPQPSVIE